MIQTLVLGQTLMLRLMGFLNAAVASSQVGPEVGLETAHPAIDKNPAGSASSSVTGIC